MAKSFMKILFMLFSIFTVNLFSQETDTTCQGIKYYNLAVTKDTTVLDNGNKLYYLADCDSTWLVLDFGNSTKSLFSVELDFIPYTFRLGYYLIKEFKNLLFFRYGCSVSGPCAYVLIDKNNGKIQKEFDHGMVVYSGEKEYSDFIIYFSEIENGSSEKLDTLTLLFIDSGKKFNSTIPSGRFSLPSPISFFDRVEIKNNKVKLYYRYFENESTKNPKVDFVAFQLN